MNLTTYQMAKLLIYLIGTRPLTEKSSSNVPFSRDGKFVDRIGIMADLEAKFSNSGHQRVALVGLGGMGCVQLILTKVIY